MRIAQTALINDLTARTKEALVVAKQLQALPEEVLNFKPTAEAWSILECLEHLNRYGDFYLPEIENRILKADAKPDNAFRSGLLGNWFANMMLPKAGEINNKMKSPADKNPAGSDLQVTTVQRFIKQLETMLRLLSQAKETSLTRVKTSISLASWIKLRLGDTLRVVVYHNERHLLQVQRTLVQAKEAGLQVAVGE